MMYSLHFAGDGYWRHMKSGGDCSKSTKSNYTFPFPFSLGERVEFSIKEGNENGLFSVDSSSGVLSLVQPLDYEEQDQVSAAVEKTTCSSLFASASSIHDRP